MLHEQQGTGKHEHKNSEQPYPHHEAPTTSGGHSEKSSGQHAKSESRDDGHSGSNNSGSTGGSEDMKQREYRGSDGQEHHHTTTYMEQHK